MTSRVSRSLNTGENVGAARKLITVAQKRVPQSGHTWVAAAGELRHDFLQILLGEAVHQGFAGQLHPTIFPLNRFTIPAADVDPRAFAHQLRHEPDMVWMKVSDEEIDSLCENPERPQPSLYGLKALPEVHAGVNNQRALRATNEVGVHSLQGIPRKGNLHSKDARPQFINHLGRRLLGRGLVRTQSVASVSRVAGRLRPLLAPTTSSRR